MIKEDNIYLESGFLNIPYIYDNGKVFNFLIGGRGIGKTYGMLKEVINRGDKFIYMRRTQKQIDMCTMDSFNPFKTLNDDLGLNIRACSIGNGFSAFYNFEKNADGKDVATGEVLGYPFALSTIGNIRSIDLSDVDIIIFEEFMRSAVEKPIKDEFIKFTDGYETANRNREIIGKPPIKVFFLSNSNSIDNDYFVSLELVITVEKLIKNHKMIYTDDERDLLLCIFRDSPISQKKKNTAMYKLLKGNEYASMSLENEFVDDDISFVKPRPLQEYNALCTLGELTIYEHKSNETYYISPHVKGNPPRYNLTKNSKAMFFQNFGYLRFIMGEGLATFETYYSQILFKKYLDID